MLSAQLAAIGYGIVMLVVDHDARNLSGVMKWFMVALLSHAVHYH